MRNYFEIPQKKLQIYLEISLEFLSSNWKYWSNFRALTAACLPFSFSQAGVPWDMNNYLRGFSTEKKFVKQWFGATVLQNRVAFTRFRLPFPLLAKRSHVTLSRGQVVMCVLYKKVVTDC
jgi:hypothetical protein